MADAALIWPWQAARICQVLDDANEAASKAISFAKSDKSYAPGLAKALEEDLAELIGRFHPE